MSRLASASQARQVSCPTRRRPLRFFPHTHVTDGSPVSLRWWDVKCFRPPAVGRRAAGRINHPRRRQTISRSPRRRRKPVCGARSFSAPAQHGCGAAARSGRAATTASPGLDIWRGRRRSSARVRRRSCPAENAVPSWSVRSLLRDGTPCDGTDYVFVLRRWSNIGCAAHRP